LARRVRVFSFDLCCPLRSVTRLPEEYLPLRPRLVNLWIVRQPTFDPETDDLSSSAHSSIRPSTPRESTPIPTLPRLDESRLLESVLEHSFDSRERSNSRSLGGETAVGRSEVGEFESDLATRVVGERDHRSTDLLLLEELPTKVTRDLGRFGEESRGEGSGGG